MNLVLVTALIAVCGADKLDRTYLPPPSAKTAGGSPGSLQAPFTRTFNQGLGGIPTGGYNNDFQGVVVDAAAPGTRASGTEQSGLGALRIAYGSADSKVGDAAFKAQNHNQGQHQPVGTPAGPGSPNFHDIGHLKPERIQAVHDRASNTVKYENEVSNAGFNYAFETDNGIVAEENGISINGVNAQGGFAYTGDDGQVYSVTYTADEGGYQPKGTHLPTPPPIPEEILKSLEQNAKDEASGVIDDGSYDAEKYNTEDDYTKSDTANEKYHGQRPAQLGNRPQADREVGGSLINQNNQGFGTNGNHYDQQPSRDSSDANGFASANSFAKAPQGNNFGFGINRDSNGQIGQNLALNQGSQNEYLPPYNGFNQNSKPTQSARPQDSQYNEQNGFPQASRPSSHSNVNTPTNKDQEDSKIPDFVPLSQQKLQDDSEVKPQANPISGKPTFVGSSLSVRPPTYTFSGSSPTNAFNQKPVNTGTAGRYEPTSGNVFGSNNEYLLPQSQFNKPGQGNQGDLNASFGTQFNRKPDLNSQSQQSANAGPYTATAFASVSQPNFAGSQQYNGFQQYQTPAGLSQASQTLPNRFPLNKVPTHFGSAPTNSPVYNRAPVGNGQFKPISLAPHPPTLQPLTELTTPLETNAAQNTVSAPLPVFDGTDSQSLTTSSDLSSFGSPSTIISGQSGINPSNLQKVSPTQASASSFASFNDQSFTSSFPSAPKPGSTGSYSNGQFQASHKPTSDVQYSSSTQSPNFSQYTQQQGPDDSYYYNQPSKPFNIPTGRPQESRFPNPSFDQANRVTPSSSFPSRPQPTGPLTSFTSQGNTASTRYPRPPSLEPTSPTVPSKQADNYYHNQFNRVTQASASSFPSVAPTVSSDFNGNHFPQFDSKPFHLANPQLDDISQFTTNSEVPTNQPGSAFTQAAASSQDPHNQGVDQLSPNTKVESTQDAPSQSPGQKYDGEIYDYKKPPPVLSSPQGPAVGNFGQKPQFGSQSQSSSQDGQSPSTGTYKPNSQFGFKQPQQLSPFGQSQNPQTTQTQAPQSQEQGHIGSIQKPTQNTQLVQGASKFPPTYRPHFVSACCKSSNFPSSQVDQQRRPFNDPATPGLSQAQKPQSPGSQGPKTDSSASSFPGVGENFGGPRKPPSFDESGYHY